MNKYNYYIALDWAQANMAIAISKKDSLEPRIIEQTSDIQKMKALLKTLKGSKILTIEESTTSQWLWVELHDYVDEIIICDPYKNFLLSSGPKNDRIDAAKLLDLLRAGLLKPVFHSAHKFMEYRKLISTYDDVIKTGVRWKNRRSAILRAEGKTKLSKVFDSDIVKFTHATADDSIAYYESVKKYYHALFRELISKSKTLRALQSIPGVGLVGAMKIAAIVVDPDRFPSKGHFWAYCGLVKHRKMSGGRSYGSRAPRFSRILKSVFKTAALASCHDRGNKIMRQYYVELLSKGMPAHKARHKVARKIATIALFTMKKNERYNQNEILQYSGGKTDDLILNNSRA